ncbi:MAG: DUF655 domain-containing protein [Desulfurococcales archaeon]|nr:DUF655 domain-containing protein [Desulfurococcales archaeon]
MYRYGRRPVRPRRGHQPRPGPSRRDHFSHPARLEKEAIVLDYMPRGNPLEPHPEHRGGIPVAQVIGTRYFTLLDGVPVIGEPEFLERVTLSFLFKTGAYRLHCVEVLRNSVACLSKSEGDPSIIENIAKEVGRFSSVKVFTDKNVFSKYIEAFGLSPRVIDTHRIPLKLDDLTTVAKQNLKEAIKKIIRMREHVFVEFFNTAEPISLRLHTLELLKGIGQRTLREFLNTRKRKGGFGSLEEIASVLRSDPVEMIAEKILSEMRGEDRYYIFLKPPLPRPDEPSRQKIYLGYLERLLQAEEA